MPSALKQHKQNVYQTKSVRIKYKKYDAVVKCRTKTESEREAMREKKFIPSSGEPFSFLPCLMVFLDGLSAENVPLVIGVSSTPFDTSPYHFSVQCHSK